MSTKSFGSDTKESPRVLVVDNEVTIHGALERLLSQEGIEVATSTGGEDALDKLENGGFDLVLADVQMPDVGGMDLLQQIQEQNLLVEVVLLSSQDNARQAASAMRKGAADYIPKPFSTDELVGRIKTVLKNRPVRDGSTVAAPSKNHRPNNESTNGTNKSINSTSTGYAAANDKGAYETSLSGVHSENGAAEASAHEDREKREEREVQFVGEHRSVQKLREMVSRIAGSQAPVFVQGESGTGKEILSRLIHEQSPRSDRPYVPVNCAALPSELVESHLFGHVEGAFTGAVDDMTGAFEKADGGTLLLDEISEITPSVQAKLLRALQTQEFQRVGSSDTTSVDVRVIATSNRDLEKAVREGSFREDLYHRLAVFPLQVPPLRGRLSDIPLLAEHFTEKYAEQYDLPPKTIAPELLQRFQSYRWPGNVRELENMIHRGVVMAGNRERITTDDVIHDFFSEGSANSEESANSKGGAEQFRSPGQNGDVQNGNVQNDNVQNDNSQSGNSPNGNVPPSLLPDGSVPTIAEMERKLILSTLSKEEVSQKKAAEKLGISPRTIRNKLQEYREQGFSL